MARRGYSSEFRRRVLSLIAAGRPIREIASDPGGSEQTIYTWRRQDRIDQGLEPGLASAALIEAHRFSTASVRTRLRTRPSSVPLRR